MCLVQNFQNGPILTKSPTYSQSMVFSQKLVILDMIKISNLCTKFETLIKNLPNAYFSFEIHHSKLKLEALKELTVKLPHQKNFNFLCLSIIILYRFVSDLMSSKMKLNTFK